MIGEEKEEGTVNILFTIQHQLEHLSKAEKKLAQWILEHSEEVIHMNVKSLSEVSETSPATVTRLCYSLGLEGFTDLKLKLSANLPEIEAGLYSDIIPNESIENIKQKIKLKVTDGIEKNAELLSIKAIEETVEWLREKSVIYTYGIGASGIVAEDFAQKFLRIGHNVIFSLDIHLLITSMVTNDRPSLLFLISNSGEKTEICELAALAKQYDIPVICMTSQAESTLAKLATVVLLTTDAGEAPLRSSATNSLLVQLYTVDVIFSSYASREYQRTIEQLEKTKKAIQLFETGQT